MNQYTSRPLDTETWDAYGRLLDKHNGAGFGCWCTWFHQRRKDQGIDTEIEAGRPYKDWLVRHGKAHAAVVFEDDVAVGWAQFGPPAELPNIHHKKNYEAGLESLPEKAGFTYDRPKGKNHCVMRKVVPPVGQD
jgi:hypothetical protein